MKIIYDATNPVAVYVDNRKDLEFDTFYSAAQYVEKLDIDLSVDVVDLLTGEVLLSAVPENWEYNEEDEEYQPPRWDFEDDESYEPDCEFDELGFSPYIGSYDFDC